MKERSQQDLRHDALDAWRAGVAAAEPSEGVRAFFARKPAPWRPGKGTSLVVASGKAACTMAAAAGRTARGFVLVPADTDTTGVPSHFEVLCGGHPLPSRAGLQASRRILNEVSRLGRDDTLIYLLSGGSSALFEVACEGVGFADLRWLYEALLGCGAPIDEVNCVRRAVSRLKGGGLAAAAYPASVWTLAVSDVFGDEPQTIGSGPTVPAREEPGSATAILRRYGLWGRLPAAIRKVVTLRGKAEPHEQRPVRLAAYEVVSSASYAQEGACTRLLELGYRATGANQLLRGDVAEACDALVGRIVEMLARKARCALVATGETTVRLPAQPGCGGRNQHLAAALALRLAGLSAFACVVAGTDGRDGSSPAAGAIIDGETSLRASRAGYPLGPALADFDTGSALAATGDTILTAATGTNVGDLVVVTVGSTAELNSPAGSCPHGA